MRLLLDTHVLIAIAHQRLIQFNAGIAAVVDAPDNRCFASTAGLWEIAIKTRLGKLDPGGPLQKLPDYFRAAGLSLLSVNDRHAVAEVVPEPATRDPFDRLLLAQCAVENLRLVTLDRALARHPLAWQPA